MQDGSSDNGRIVVWDLPTRLFHWLLVVLLAFLWWTAETDRVHWHKLAGFAVIGLLVFRIVWGLIGSETARFSHFLRGPVTVWRYLRGNFGHCLGHNPLGGWSVAILLVLTSAESVLGLFSVDDDGLDPGPLSPKIGMDAAQTATHWHALLFNVLLGFIALHIAAIFAYLAFRQNLIGPMITGRARAALGTAHPKRGSIWAFAASVILACAVGGYLYWLDQS